MLALSHNGNQISQYTNKGFTGQYNDPTSGLDYYVSRYYDSVSGVFFSADKTLGDATGMNPYSYVGNNPETYNDPTGQAYIPPGNGSGGTGGNGNNNGNGNSGGSSGSGGGGGCGWWNAWCWFGGGGNGGSGNSGSGTPHLPLNLMDSSPYGVGGEASEIQGPEGLGGSLDGQMAEADAELTEEGELRTLDAEVPQLVDDPGDALQAQALTEETVEAFKGDVGQEDAAQDVKEYGDTKPVTTDTPTTTTDTNTTNQPTDKTPTDLYRMGRGGKPENGGHPDLNNLRYGSEYVIDTETFDRIVPEAGTPPGYGISTFDSPFKGRNWWMLPAGSRLPPGLQVVADPELAGHYLFEPITDMTTDEFNQLINQTSSFWRWFGNVK